MHELEKTGFLTQHLNNSYSLKAKRGGGGEATAAGGSADSCPPCSCRLRQSKHMCVRLLVFLIHRVQLRHFSCSGATRSNQTHTQTAAGERVDPCAYFAVLSSSLMHNSQRWASRSRMGQSAPPSIPAASSTATARVSKPTASLNAPHMCSCCSAV